MFKVIAIFALLLQAAALQPEQQTVAAGAHSSTKTATAAHIHDVDTHNVAGNAESPAIITSGRGVSKRHFENLQGTLNYDKIQPAHAVSSYTDTNHMASHDSGDATVLLQHVARLSAIINVIERIADVTVEEATGAATPVVCRHITVDVLSLRSPTSAPHDIPQPAQVACRGRLRFLELKDLVMGVQMLPTHPDLMICAPQQLIDELHSVHSVTPPAFAALKELMRHPMLSTVQPECARLFNIPVTDTAAHRQPGDVVEILFTAPLRPGSSESHHKQAGGTPTRIWDAVYEDTRWKVSQVSVESYLLAASTQHESLSILLDDVDENIGNNNIDQHGDAAWTLEERANVMLDQVMMEVPIDMQGEAVDPVSSEKEAHFVGPQKAAMEWSKFRQHVMRDFFGPYAGAVDRASFLEAQDASVGGDDDMDVYERSDVVSRTKQGDAQWASFLETKSTSLAKGNVFLEMLLKPVIFGVCKPVIKIVAEQLGDSLMENMQENIQARMVEQLPTDVATAIANNVAGGSSDGSGSRFASVSAEDGATTHGHASNGPGGIIGLLVGQLSSTLTNSLSASVIKDIGGHLRKHVPPAVIPNVVHHTSHVITDTAVNETSTRLVSDVSRGITAALGAILARSIPHTLVSTLSATLNPVRLAPVDEKKATALDLHCQTCEAIKSDNAIPIRTPPMTGLPYAQQSNELHNGLLNGLTDVITSLGMYGPFSDSLACLLCQTGGDLPGDTSPDATLTRQKLLTQHVAHYYAEYYSRYFAAYYDKVERLGAKTP